MHKMKTIDAEIARCRQQLTVLNSEADKIESNKGNTYDEKLTYTDNIVDEGTKEVMMKQASEKRSQGTRVAKAILEFLIAEKLIPEITEDRYDNETMHAFAERHQRNMDSQTPAYTYGYRRFSGIQGKPIDVKRIIGQLGLHIKEQLPDVITELTLAPPGISIYYKQEPMQQMAILLTTHQPPHEHQGSVTLLELHQSSASSLYEQCKRLPLTSIQTMELFEYFYTRFVIFRNNDDERGEATFIRDGTDAQHRLDFCNEIITNANINLDSIIHVNNIEGNVCFNGCKTLTREIYGKILAPRDIYMRSGDEFSAISHSAENGREINVRNHPFFPKKMLDIRHHQQADKVSANFTLTHTSGINEVNPSATRIYECKSKYALFYCICAFMEPQGEESFVCKALRSEHRRDPLPKYTAEQDAGSSYIIP